MPLFIMQPLIINLIVDYIDPALHQLPLSIGRRLPPPPPPPRTHFDKLPHHRSWSLAPATTAPATPPHIPTPAGISPYRSHHCSAPPGYHRYSTNIAINHFTTTDSSTTTTGGSTSLPLFHHRPPFAVTIPSPITPWVATTTPPAPARLFIRPSSLPIASRYRRRYRRITRSSPATVGNFNRR